MLSRLRLRRVLTRMPARVPAAATTAAAAAVRRVHAAAPARMPSFSVTQSPSLVNATSTVPVLQTLQAMRKQREAWRSGATVGFVPTMGALHSGHLELVKRAQKECDRVVVSIYVNPTQFGVGEDFAKYPRQLAADVAKLQGLADVVFAPTDALMYRKRPPHATYVTVEGLHRDALNPGAQVAPLSSAEAQARPTHFRGVATVVTKLFNIVQPSRAYFGAKDGMQCILLRRVARELNQPTRIIICPTVREPDGLAMSSRNVYLTAADRAVAPVVYRALQAGNRLFEAGERSANAIRSAVTAVLAAEKAVTIQYVSIADANTGAELTGNAVGTGLAAEPADAVIGGSTIVGTGGVAASGEERLEGEEEDDGEDNESGAVAMLSVAVKLGNTRLIDNLLLGDKSR